MFYFVFLCILLFIMFYFSIWRNIHQSVLLMNTNVISPTTVDVSVELSCVISGKTALMVKMNSIVQVNQVSP